MTGCIKLGCHVSFPHKPHFPNQTANLKKIWSKVIQNLIFFRIRVEMFDTLGMKFEESFIVVGKRLDVGFEGRKCLDRPTDIESQTDVTKRHFSQTSTT